MLKETIFLKDVLTQISTLDDKGRAPLFSITFRTLNRNSKTGGRLVSYEKAKLAQKEDHGDQTTFEALRTVPKPRTNIKRNPQHFRNKTRNLVVLPQKKTRKVHINLITEFNGKTVVY